ncbi:basic proline-rich protein-like [Homarus americanus]|uniref:basic proline-rich protein-like n=1 Tax=Homarus americanus TaxID=6706 RepID=UPI001C497BD6|nr:basic proline-rich protein-like [Homarus americanus]
MKESLVAPSSLAGPLASLPPTPLLRRAPGGSVAPRRARGGATAPGKALGTPKAVAPPRILPGTPAPPGTFPGDGATTGILPRFPGDLWNACSLWVLQVWRSQSPPRSGVAPKGHFRGGSTTRDPLPGVVAFPGSYTGAPPGIPSGTSALPGTLLTATAAAPVTLPQWHQRVRDPSKAGVAPKDPNKVLPKGGGAPFTLPGAVASPRTSQGQQRPQGPSQGRQRFQGPSKGRWENYITFPGDVTPPGAILGPSQGQWHPQGHSGTAEPTGTPTSDGAPRVLNSAKTTAPKGPTDLALPEPSKERRPPQVPFQGRQQPQGPSPRDGGIPTALHRGGSAPRGGGATHCIGATRDPPRGSVAPGTPALPGTLSRSAAPSWTLPGVVAHPGTL